MSYFKERMAEIAAENAKSAALAKIIPAKIQVQRAERRLRQGYVYFFRAGNTVKIGFTTDVRERSHSLQIGCPEKAFMAKVVKGTSSTERQFHKRFAEYRLRGEWFDLRGSLAKYLERHFKPIDLPAPVMNEPEDEPGYL